jgi:hypothetical protein
MPDRLKRLHGTAQPARFAGTAQLVAEKVGELLLHGLVREDGTVADETAAVLNDLAARKLKELKR